MAAEAQVYTIASRGSDFVSVTGKTRLPIIANSTTMTGDKSWREKNFVLTK